MNDKKESLSVVAIVQARFGSTRLRGKIFKNLIDQPMLKHVVNRLSYSKYINKVVVATTTETDDDQVEAYCKLNTIPCYRGSSNDVLARYFEAAKIFRANTIIRITADCPLIDPEIIDRMIETFNKLNELKFFDYLSNTIHRTFPRGLDVEIFSFNSLRKAFYHASKEYEREHVTPFIYEHSKLFRIKNYPNPKDYSFHRWTVDTEEDFKLVEEIYKALYSSKKIFLFNDILKLFEERPDLISINQNVKQKKLGDKHEDHTP